MLVLDEAVAALDVSVQAQILALLTAIRRDTGVAPVFVSHDLAVVQHLTDEVLVMRRGTVVEQGPTAGVQAGPQAPCTGLLLASVPREGWGPADAAGPGRPPGSDPGLRERTGPFRDTGNTGTEKAGAPFLRRSGGAGLLGYCSLGRDRPTRATRPG